MPAVRRVVVPSLTVSIEHSNLARREDLDIVDAVGLPTRDGAGRRSLVLEPGEAHIRRSDGFAVLPPRVTQLERRDEATVGRVGIVGHDAKTTVLQRGDLFRETCDQLVARVTTDERFRHGGRDKTRRRTVVEDGNGFADQADDDITSRRWSGGAGADDQGGDEREADGAARRQISVGLRLVPG